MRVIAGSARRLILETPEGNEVRPTLDRIKETIYNVINQQVVQATFLDVFSGSGAMGIEALSRGAAKAYFVEKSKEAYTCIKNNLNHTKLIDKAVILQYDYSMALNKLKNDGIKFDVIFLDPPYNKGLEEAAMLKIHEFSLLNDGGMIVCESAANTDLSFIDDIECFEVFKEKKYKTTKVTFIDSIS